MMIDELMKITSTIAIDINENYQICMYPSHLLVGSQRRRNFSLYTYLYITGVYEICRWWLCPIVDQVYRSIDRFLLQLLYIPRKALSASGGDEGESVWRRLKSTKLMDRWMANKISTPPIFFLIDLQVYTVLVRELYTHCNDRSTNKVAIYSTYIHLAE